MQNKTHILRIRAVNRDIFDAIKNGKKKVETRAATPRYRHIEAGDTVSFVCGKQRFSIKVKKVRIFWSIRALARAYAPRAINPSCKTLKELECMYFSFPNYREKLKKGIIAFELC